MFIYGLKNCDSCKKAYKALPNAEFIDIRAAPLSPEKLKAFYTAFPDTLINRRSTTWRNLSESQRNSEPLALLMQHAALMKRPVIEANGKLYLGWAREVKAALNIS